MAGTSLRRLLLIEDDPDIQTIARLVLELGGLTVVGCSSGPEALATVADAAPDLILLDRMMPQMDGLATLAALRARPDTATTPVIFLTATVHPDALATYQALGAWDTIAKPFDPMTLPDTIRRIWARERG
jgi:CheY-like chemotaxis protein